MQKVRNSDFLKILCYIAIPILVAVFIFGIGHMMYLNQMDITKNITKYSQTKET